MTTVRIERLYAAVVDQLVEADPESVMTLRVRVAAGAEMSEVPAGVDHELWSELRRGLIDNESLHPDSKLRRRLGASLNDIDLMRRTSG